MIERKNIHPNVDYPTGPTYHLMGFDTDFFTPIFVLAGIKNYINNHSAKYNGATCIKQTDYRPSTSICNFSIDLISYLLLKY